MEKSGPPLFARIMLGVSALLTVGVVYWFLSKALESLPEPSISIPKTAQSFNQKADVTKSPVFQKLEEKYFVDVPDMPQGRDNPFIALDTVSATSSESVPIGGAPAKNSQIRIQPLINQTSTEQIPAQINSTSTYE